MTDQGTAPLPVGTDEVQHDHVKDEIEEPPLEDQVAEMRETVTNLDMGVARIFQQMDELINTVKELKESNKRVKIEVPSQASSSRQIRNAYEPESRPEWYTGYDLKSIRKLYSDSLRNTRVSKVPDFKFETAFMTWKRLLRDTPVPEEYRRALMALAFEGVALKIFEEAAMEAAEKGETSDQLWEKLRERICNSSHIISLRSQIMNVKYDERRESISQYATRLRTMSLNLPERMSKDMLTNLFVQGLPNKLKLMALTVQGSYDEVVSRTALIHYQMKLREAIRPIGEEKDKKTSMEKARDEWMRNRTCFYCHEKGHVILHCPKRIASEKRKAEQAARRAAAPAAPAVPAAPPAPPAPAAPWNQVPPRQPNQGNGEGGAPPS